MELFNEPRFAEPWFADDQHELAFARPNALPPAGEQAEFLIATDKRRQRARAASSACAASSNDAEELDRLGQTLEFARALVIDDKEPRDLKLNIPGDEHRARVGRTLHASGDIRRIAEHLARRLDHNRARLESDARGELRRAFRGVSSIDLGKGALDRERRPHRALGVVLLCGRIAEEGHEPVAEPLQHVAAKPSHRRCGLVEIGVDQAAPILGVEPRRERRRTDQIAEHDRDRAALGGDFRDSFRWRRRSRRRGGLPRSSRRRQCGYGSEQFAPIADGRDAYLLEVLRRQVRKYCFVDPVVAKRGLVSLKANLFQPRSEVHAPGPEIDFHYRGVELGCPELPEQA